MLLTSLLGKNKFKIFKSRIRKIPIFKLIIFHILKVTTQMHLNHKIMLKTLQILLLISKILKIFSITRTSRR